jgi:hypothetical protein
VLTAADELRHEPTPDRAWRESLYFNFSDPANEIGAWIYLWLLPNGPLPCGMLVCFYHGLTARLDAQDAAMQSPGHLLHGDGGAWVYCYKAHFSEPLPGDLDNVSLGGLRLLRKGPFEGYSLTFADDAGNAMDLDCRFLSPPWDYAEGIDPTPEWFATNRYHRPWHAQGTLQLGRRTIAIDTFGDSDHSWGRRDRRMYTAHGFKMWSFQSPDGQRQLSALIQEGGAKMGFLREHGVLSGVASVRDTALFTPAGIPAGADVELVDGAGRRIRARLPRLFAAIGWGDRESMWGYEGAGVYDVDGSGPCSGVASYSFPGAIDPASLPQA